MSLLNVQLANTPCYTDFPFLNTSGAIIAEGVAVSVDVAVALGDASVPGVPIKVVATDGDPTLGVTMEAIGIGATGRVRCLGPIVAMKADGAITAGTHVMASGTTAKKGFAKAAGSAKSSLGIALNPSTSDGDLVLVLLGGAKNA